MKKTITILTPTLNEVGNIDELRSRISKITEKNQDTQNLLKKKIL